MATDRDYVDRIREVDYPRLTEMWDSVRAGRAIRGWAKGKAFEYLLLRALELEGAEIVWPYEVRVEGIALEQIDGMIYYEHLACLVEAKDYGDDIAIAPIAKLRNQLLRRPSSVIGLVFSRSGFTDAAKTLSRYTFPQTVLLWEGEEISHALPRREMCKGLKAKYRYAAEKGLSDYNLKREELP